ncbi:MAG: MBOAT family O-acyltransferase [Myxococcota bacterium]
MVFSTQIFLLWFLPIALLGYYALPVRFRTLWLTATSYLFYGWARPEYCLLLLGVTVLSYVATARMDAATTPAVRRRWLVASVTISLGALGFFKYAGMLATWLRTTLGWVGLSPDAVPALSIVLPIGISFFTFQAISYTVDVYRGHGRPARRFLEYASYIALFPQLIAGPIVRYEWIEHDLHSRQHSWGKAWLGLRFLGFGLAKKALLADTFALGVPAGFGPEDPGFVGAWVGTLSYTLQIYFDFSAYSDMAVGLGLLLGFRFPKNFDSPYRSASITEFWRRWHISLSSFLRDYLYIPLGGNQRTAVRTYVNLMIVMVLGGLWHGASIVFLLWGFWHGALLAIERALGDRHPLARLPRPLAIGVTTLLAMIGWVLFRAEDLTMAARVLGAMFWPSSFALPALVHPALYALLPLGFAVCWWAPNSWEWAHRASWGRAVSQAVLIALSLFTVLAYAQSPFLYFQF